MEEEIIYNIEVKGADKLSKIETDTKKVSTATKDNTGALKSQSEALDNTKFGGVINGFKGMIAGAKAFIATPIGLVIGALGLALAAVSSYLTGTEEGQHKLNKVMNVGAAVLGKVTDAVQLLGEYLVKYVIKGFELAAEALSFLIPGFDEFTESVSSFLNLDTAAKISEMEERAVLLNRELILKKRILEAEIEDAKLRAESTKDIGIRTAALKEAQDKVNELFDAQTELAKLDRDIAIAKGEQANNDIAANDAIEEAKAKVFELDRARSQQLTTITTKVTALSEQDKAASEARIEQKRKEDEEESDIERARARRKVELLYATDEITFEQKVALEARIQGIDDETRKKSFAATASILASRVAAHKAETRSKQDQAKIQQGVDAANVQAAMAIFSLISGLAKKNTLAAKAAGIAEATINTYIAANKALSAGLGVPAGAILAGLTIATGLANVAKIAGVGGFASGGLTGKRIGRGDGTPINRSNGDNLLATVRTGEVILNERQQAALGGNNTFARLGVPGFASGGLTATNSESRIAQNQLLNSIQDLQLFVSVEEINTGQNNVRVVQDRATI
jgi:hypothetical protein